MPWGVFVVVGVVGFFKALDIVEASFEERTHEISEAFLYC
jgi:type IV secretory pathway VirB2 component (pilin)